jgi:hypothetical protein
VCQKRPATKKVSALKARPSNSKANPASKKDAQKPARTARTKPNITVTRTSVSHRARETSIDRSFIVPDNVVYLDSDISSSDTESFDSTLVGDDSDVEMCDAALENVEDLRIDMRARYA